MAGCRYDESSSCSLSSSTSSEEPDGRLECPLCWESFNTTCHLPYVLWCGHSICKSCLLGLEWATVELPVAPVQLTLLIACPWCHSLSCRLLWRGKLKYPCQNFFLLWLVESTTTGPGRAEQQLHLHGHHEGMKVRPADDVNVPATAAPSVPQSAGDPAAASDLICSKLSPLQQSCTSAQSELRSLDRCFRKLGCLCALLAAKSVLMLLVMFILFWALPCSALVLMVHFVVTLMFAFPSFLVVYFAFLCLNRLLKEIVT